MDSETIPVLESGVIIYIGDKENLGNTVIVEQTNGIDVFYSNIEPVNINIYDYINNSHVEYLDMKNVTMTIRAKSGENCRHMPGLLVTVSNARLRLENI